MNKINCFTKIAMIAGLYVVTGGVLHASSEELAPGSAPKTVVTIGVNPEFGKLLEIDATLLSDRSKILTNAAAKCISKDLFAVIKIYADETNSKICGTGLTSSTLLNAVFEHLRKPENIEEFKKFNSKK